MFSATARWRARTRPERITWRGRRGGGRHGETVRGGADKEGRNVLVMRPGRENSKEHAGNIRFLIYTLERATWRENRTRTRRSGRTSNTTARSSCFSSTLPGGRSPRRRRCGRSPGDAQHPAGPLPGTPGDGGVLQPALHLRGVLESHLAVHRPGDVPESPDVKTKPREGDQPNAQDVPHGARRAPTSPVRETPRSTSRRSRRKPTRTTNAKTRRSACSPRNSPPRSDDARPRKREAMFY